MSDNIAWLAVPDFAESLGVLATHVRDLMREGTIVAVRRGANDAWYIPADFIIEEDGEPQLLKTVPGTITLLKDMGLTDAEIIDWLFEESDELGTTPMAALREGRRSPVRRAAQTLG